VSKSNLAPEHLPLTAVLITLNAADQLAKALNSVQFCNEIIVIDSGSTDLTQVIAQTHNARFIHSDWKGFGPQKHWAVSQARHDWVLCIDADEQVTPALQQSILAALAVSNQQRPQAYDMPRSNFFIDRYLRHGEGYPDRSLRLFNRKHAQWSQDIVHEKVLCDTPVGHLQGDLLHRSADNLHNYLQKQNRYTTLQAQTLYQRNKNPGAWRLLLSPWLRFLKFYIFRQGFRDGVPGLIHIGLGCYNSFIKYAKARDLFVRSTAPAVPAPHKKDRV
jgi:glycosyltransferase involved in cell wall biosynthesis